MPFEGQKKISDTQESLKFLFQNKDNSTLFNLLKDEILKNYQFEKANIREDFELNQVIDTIVLEALNDFVFYPCQAIYLYHGDPFKLLKWLTAFIRNLENKLQVVVLKLLSIATRDRRRFDQENGNLQYIQAEIERKVFHSSVNISLIPAKWQHYFELSSFDEYVNSFLAVRGMLQTQEETVSDFVQNNGFEILRQLQINEASNKLGVSGISGSNSSKEVMAEIEMDGCEDRELQRLKTIFQKEEYFEAICTPLFIEFDIIDRNGEYLLSERKGYLLFAVIDAIKTYSNQLLIRLYSDEELLDLFNKYFTALSRGGKTNFKKIKRDSKGFKTYNEKCKTFIEQHLRQL